MNHRPRGQSRPPARTGPGRGYTFLVIALATVVIGLTVGPPRIAGPAGPKGSSSVLESNWSPAQLSVLFGVAAGLGGLAALLAGRGLRPDPRTDVPDPQQITEQTGMPVVGQLFPLPPTSSSGSCRWIVFPAELVLMAAVLLSFHAAVTRPGIARKFTRDPFSAYKQSVDGWQAKIEALQQR